MALTGEQRKQIDQALAPLKAEAACTDPINREECIAGFNALYAALNLPPPECHFFSNPLETLRKVDAISADNQGGYEAVLGEEVDASFNYECNQVFEPFVLQPIWSALASRVDRQMALFRDMFNVVDSRLEDEPVGQLTGSMLCYGNSSFWAALGKLARVEAFASIGIAARPEVCVLARRALSTCNQCFTYERFCFISERPESFHHPALSKEGPRDRIIVKWRDGFVCDEELWY